MILNALNATKQPQLLQLQALLQRAYSAYERFQRASSESTYSAFNHATLHGENWRSQILQQAIRRAEKTISLALDGTESIEVRSLSQQASDCAIERAWQCVFWMSYCYANAATLENAIEEMRKRIGQAVSYDSANTQSSLLKTKTDALRDCWRKTGVPEILVGEITNQLQQLSPGPIEVLVLDADQTWTRGISALSASVEEYENLVERYEQTIAKIVAGLSE